jgi:hypothetical protein
LIKREIPTVITNKGQKQLPASGGKKPKFFNNQKVPTKIKRKIGYKQ